MTHLERERQTIFDIARKLGASAGKAAGSWVLDGNSAEDAARRVLKGFDDGDPAILDMQPSPLSGEWADGLTEDDVLDEVAIYADKHVDDDAREDLIAAWLDAYSEGFWDEVIREARRRLGVAS